MARRNKPRKWSNLKDQLPAPPPRQNSEWFDKVIAAKDARAGSTMNELAQEYELLCAEEEAAAQARSERNIKFEALDRRILEELEKVQAVSGQDMWRGVGQTFSPKFDPYPIIEDKQALRAWVLERGMDLLLTLPKSTLKSLVKEAFDTDLAAQMSPGARAKLKPGDAGSGAAPPGVTVFLKTGVHRTGGSKRSRDDDDD